MLHIGCLITLNALMLLYFVLLLYHHLELHILHRRKPMNSPTSAWLLTKQHSAVSAQSIHKDSNHCTCLAKLCIFVLLIWHCIYKHFEPFG